MSTPFSLEIITPTGVFWQGDCLCLTLPLADGSLQIMAHHSDEIAHVTMGCLRIRTPEDEVVFATMGGVMHCIDGTCRLLLQYVADSSHWQEMVEQQQQFFAQQKQRRRQSYMQSRITALALARAFEGMRTGGKSNQD